MWYIILRQVLGFGYIGAKAKVKPTLHGVNALFSEFRVTLGNNRKLSLIFILHVRRTVHELKQLNRCSQLFTLILLLITQTLMFNNYKS